MAHATVAFALAARAHGRDGRPLKSRETLERMRSAAGSFAGERPGLVAGPTQVVDAGTVVMLLASPEAVLPAARTVAHAAHPASTTFSAAMSGLERSESPDQQLDPAILVAERAASEAADRIGEADFREARFIVAGPPPGDLLGVLLGLILETYDAMTDRQRQIVELVRESDTQQKVATHLGVSRQAVNQSLLAAGWPYLERAEAVAVRELSAMWRAGFDGYAGG